MEKADFFKLANYPHFNFYTCNKCLRVEEVVSNHVLVILVLFQLNHKIIESSLCGQSWIVTGFIPSPQKL